ncbi:MAG: DNA alkylation repair protein [Clostridiales bacterium]|nr:DNA alkylation repair protein [Clostridiales bacterium]
MQDLGYKAFHEKLIPTVDPQTVIGIRTPELRKYARRLAKTEVGKVFLHTLPHTYYEENNLHAFVIETISDYEPAMEETERFLPYINNWATCDLFSPKVFRRYPKEAYEKAKEFIQSDQTYTIRYGIKLLMDNYLDDNFMPEMPALVAGIHSEEYYVNMMCAWYMATALAKQEKEVLPYIEKRKLDVLVHNKTIQKAVESRRISPELKTYLKTLRYRMR